jgi:hypothetical protein
VFSNDAGLQSDRGAKSFTVIGDTSWNGNYWNGSYDEAQYRLNGVVSFELTGLQPGTTYSIEVRAVADVQDTDDLYTYWSNDNEYTQAEAGDGGWTNAQTRQGNYGHATTYLSAAAQNVTRNSAEVAVNLQNSHLVDSLDAQKAGYVAINKCTTYEEEGYYYECDNYVSNVDNDFEEEGDYSRFAMPQISRYPVTQTQYVDGQLSAIVNMTQLTENTKYEVVFGMDYWPTTNDYIMWDYWADEAIVHYGEASNRKAFDLTLDGSYCDGITSPSDEANCYNGAQNNDLFRTGVVSFITGNDNGIAPALTDYAPGNYDEEVATDSDLELTFSEDVLRGNVGHTIKVYDVAAAKVVYTVDVTSASVAGSGNSWTVDLPNLAANSQYTITIEAGTFVDSVGNPFAGQTINFITEGDTEAPTLDSITTVSSQEEGLADVDTTVTLNFSEDIVAGTSMIEVRRSSDSKLIFSVAPGATKDITIDGSSATISLPKNLDYSTEYYVYVPAGAFSDVNGNAFAGNSNAIFEGDSTTAFTTQSEPSFLGTIVIGGEKNNVRSYTVNYGKANAYLSVKLYWLDPHVNRYRYMTTIFLDANGYAKVNVTHFGINQFDIVKGRVGNHWTSSSRAWIA